MPAAHAQLPFDIKLFLHIAEETHLKSEDVAKCLSFWNEWQFVLHSTTVSLAGCAFLAVWLDESVEQAVDDAWSDSPSYGFRLNALAQTLCMCAVHARIPEIEKIGCAPVPAPDPTLARLLTDAGLPARAREGMLLARRYALVTPKPYKGGCSVCALYEACPTSPAKPSPNKKSPAIAGVTQDYTGQML